MTALHPVASSEYVSACAEGDDCVKSPVSDMVSMDEIEGHCIELNGEKSF